MGEKEKESRKERNMVGEMISVVRVLRVRTRLIKTRKYKMKRVILMCLIVIMIEGER